MKTILTATLLGAMLGVGATASTAADKLDKAKESAKEITDLRSSLAKTLPKDVEPTIESFKSTCGAVGKRVKEISEKEGLMIRHATTKNRNPQNAATPAEEAVIKRFSENGVVEFVDAYETDGKKFKRYSMPIYVEEACLLCHGDSAPRFVKEKYPDDRAFGYRAGDLRAIISVSFPESK